MNKFIENLSLLIPFANDKQKVLLIDLILGEKDGNENNNLVVREHKKRGRPFGYKLKQNIDHTPRPKGEKFYLEMIHCQYSGCPDKEKIYPRKDMLTYKDIYFCSRECIENFKKFNNIVEL